MRGYSGLLKQGIICQSFTQAPTEDFETAHFDMARILTS
jgi:hypothetical protein